MVLVLVCHMLTQLVWPLASTCTQVFGYLLPAQCGCHFHHHHHHPRHQFIIVMINIIMTLPSSEGIPIRLQILDDVLMMQIGRKTSCWQWPWLQLDLWYDWQPDISTPQKYLPFRNIFLLAFKSVPCSPLAAWLIPGKTKPGGTLALTVHPGQGPPVRVHPGSPTLSSPDHFWVPGTATS